MYNNVPKPEKMKNTSFLWSYILAFAGGAALVIFHSHVNLFETIVFIIGALFLLSSAFMLYGIFFPDKKTRNAGLKPNPAIWGPVTGGAIFGILLMVIPGFFVKYLIYTFGVLLIVCGLIQISGVSSGMRHDGTSAWFLAVPMISIVTGAIVIFAGPDQIQNIILLLTGIMLMVYGINGITDIIMRRKLGSTKIANKTNV